MKHLFTLFFVLQSCFVFCQNVNLGDDYLDTSRSAYFELSDEARSDSVFIEKNIIVDPVDRPELGSDSVTIYCTNADEFNHITITQRNIARIILYTTLERGTIDGQDSYVEISIFRNGELDSTILIKGPFDSKSFNQKYYNTRGPGIDQIRIKFNTNNDNRFLISKLKVVPYSDEAAKELAEIEQSAKIFNDWKQKNEDALEEMKTLYTTTTYEVNMCHMKLSTLLTVHTGQNVAKEQGLSLNPIKNSAFLSSYESFLKTHASPSMVKQFDTLKKRFEVSPNVTDLLTLVDEFMTGGRFSTLISFVGQAVNSQIQLTGAEPLLEHPVVKVGDAYFNQSKIKAGGAKIVLEKADRFRNEVDSLQQENQNYTMLLDTLITYYYEDVDQWKRLKELMDEAAELKQSYEELTDMMFGDYVADSMLSFTDIHTDIGPIKDKWLANFDIAGMTEDQKLTERMSGRRAMDKRDELREEWDDLMSAIMTQYNLMFETVPHQRYNRLKDLSPALKELGEAQLAVATEYKRVTESGKSLKESIKDLTKNNKKGIAAQI